LRNFLRSNPPGGGTARAEGVFPEAGYPAAGEAAGAVARFRDALADDFNTPRAMSELFDLVRAANHDEVPGAGAAALEMLGLVGLESLAESGGEGPDDAALALLADREKARSDRDFEAADRIRDELAALGWQVRDSAEGASLVPRSGTSGQ
jgi:cysteinyl-tRNA synthetase